MFIDTEGISNTNFRYNPFRGNAPKGAFNRIFTVALGAKFQLFILNDTRENQISPIALRTDRQITLCNSFATKNIKFCSIQSK